MGQVLLSILGAFKNIDAFGVHSVRRHVGARESIVIPGVLFDQFRQQASLDLRLVGVQLLQGYRRYGVAVAQELEGLLDALDDLLGLADLLEPPVLLRRRFLAAIATPLGDARLRPLLRSRLGRLALRLGLRLRRRRVRLACDIKGSIDNTTGALSGGGGLSTHFCSE